MLTTKRYFCNECGKELPFDSVNQILRNRTMFCEYCGKRVIFLIENTDHYSPSMASDSNNHLNNQVLEPKSRIIIPVKRSRYEKFET